MKALKELFKVGVLSKLDSEREFMYNWARRRLKNTAPVEDAFVYSEGYRVGFEDGAAYHSSCTTQASVIMAEGLEELDRLLNEVNFSKAKLVKQISLIRRNTRKALEAGPENYIRRIDK